MTYFFKSIASIVAATLLASGSGVSSQSRPVQASIRWQQTYGDEGLWNRYKVSTLAPDGGLFVATAAAKIGNLAAVRPLILQIDADGKFLQQWEIHAADLNLKQTPEINGLYITPGRELAAVVSTSTKVLLVRFDLKGKLLGSKLVSESAGEFVVTHVVADQANKALVIMGVEGAAAVIVRADFGGILQWRQTVNKAKQNVAWDAVPTPDGGCVVVGSSGTFDPTFNGETSVWIIDFGLNGKKLSEQTSVGRFGSLAHSSDGYAFVYDKNASGPQSIAVQFFTPQLKLVEEKRVLEYTPTVPTAFKIFIGPSGDYVIAGSRNTNMGFYLARVNPASHQIAEAWTPELRLGASYDVLCSGNDQCALVTSLIVRNGAKSWSGKVDVTKFNL
jgi:hypothetical protein